MHTLKTYPDLYHPLQPNVILLCMELLEGYSVEHVVDRPDSDRPVVWRHAATLHNSIWHRLANAL